MQVWEGGVHGDGFLSGPALEKLGIRAGTQNDALFHALDWVPTLAAMVGAPLEGKPVDGVNQLDTLRGGAEAREELFLGFSYDSKSQGGVADAYTAVREGRWKLVRHPDRKTYELFDLVNDPWENKDMSSGQQDQVDYLKKRMLAYENTFIEPMEAEEACSRVTEYDVTDWDQLAAVPWC